MCDDQLCSDCNRLTRICTTCLSNASVVTNKCVCNSGYYANSVDKQCYICDNLCTTCVGGTIFACTTCTATRIKVNNICLRGCPYGFVTPSCSTVTNAVINADFDTTFMSTYASFFRTGTTEASYQHFWTTETFDPIPAMNRGLYFSTSYLETTSSFWLSYTLSLCMWVKIVAGNSGDLIGKGSFMRITSSGVFRVTTERETLSTQTLTTNSQTLSTTN